MRDDVENIQNIERKKAGLLRRFERMSSYQRYFDGYTEIREVDEFGKKKGIKRIYTANYITLDADDRRWRTVKIAEAICYVAAIAAYLVAAGRQLSGTETPYVVIPGLLAAFFFLMELMPMVSHVSSKRNMTKWEYESGPKRVKLYSMLSGICLLLAACGVVVQSLLNGAFTAQATLGLICYLTAAAAAFVIWLIEKNSSYREEENMTPVPLEADNLMN